MRNGRNKTIKTARNQINQFVRCTQVLDEFSKQTENDYVGVVRRVAVMGRARFRRSATYLMPGDSVLGCCCRKSVICVCDGRIMFSRSLKASWNVIEPFIASLVRRATSSPLPQNLASSSMPSSWITVESTSKQTTLESRIICAAAAEFFDLSLPVGGWLAQGEPGKRKTVA